MFKLTGRLDSVDDNDLTVTITMTVGEWRRCANIIGKFLISGNEYYAPLSEIKQGILNTIYNIEKREELSSK